MNKIDMIVANARKECCGAFELNYQISPGDLIAKFAQNNILQSG